VPPVVAGAPQRVKRGLSPYLLCPLIFSNPVENLWHYRRNHHWSNRAYADYDAIREAACDTSQITRLDPEIIKSVCAVSYL